MLSKLSELRLGRFGPWVRRNVFWSAVVAVAVVLWANRYGYVQMTFPTGHTLPVRIHRLTGYAEVLYPVWGGEPAYWSSVGSEKDEPPKR